MVINYGDGGYKTGVSRGLPPTKCVHPFKIKRGKEKRGGGGHEKFDPVAMGCVCYWGLLQKVLGKFPTL